MDFDLFGWHINNEFVVFTGIIFFLGLTVGWFFKKGSVFMMIIALIVFAPVLDIIMKVDHPVFTVPFVLGFLVHTAKPIYIKLTKR